MLGLMRLKDSDQALKIVDTLLNWLIEGFKTKNSSTSRSLSLLNSFITFKVKDLFTSVLDSIQRYLRVKSMVNSVIMSSVNNVTEKINNKYFHI